MIFHDVKQGSDDWLDLRLGIPTASRFDVIISATTLKPLNAVGAQTYRHGLIYEWLFGVPCDSVSTPFMQRGNDLEGSARARYEFERDVEVTNGGFCTTDDGKVGDSPDGLVGEDGCVEIKVLGAAGHVGHMLEDLDAKKYLPQVYGHLFVTGRDWCDLVFYHPNLSPVVERIERDDETMEVFTKSIGHFNKQLEAAKELLKEEKRRIDETILA